MPKLHLKVFDFIIILLSASAVAAVSFIIYSGATDTPVLRVSTAEAEYIYPLDGNTEVEAEGPLGHTHIIIRDGEAFMSESPCDNKLCILSGPVSAPGHWAACLPNRVFISVEGGNDDEEIDVLSY